MLPREKNGHEVETTEPRADYRNPEAKSTIEMLRQLAEVQVVIFAAGRARVESPGQLRPSLQNRLSRCYRRHDFRVRHERLGESFDAPLVPCFCS